MSILEIVLISAVTLGLSKEFRVSVQRICLTFPTLGRECASLFLVYYSHAKGKTGSQLW